MTEADGWDERHIRLLIQTSLGLVLVATLLPWQRATVLTETRILYGFDLNTGLVNVVLVAITIVSLRLTDYREYAYGLMCGLIVSMFALWEILDPLVLSLEVLGRYETGAVSESVLDVFTPEFGVYLALFGGLGVTVASLTIARDVHGTWW